MNVSILRTPHAVRLALILLACAITILGWKLLWFLTDDAFISFRYVANWLAGVGPTWNPSPFQHVEGYSNFSWVVLLSAIWGLTGLEPPQVANNVLLFFGLGTVLLSAWWLAKIIYREQNNWLPHIFFLLALLLICSNKSFLTWLSSGLETSLFTLLLMGWAYACCGRGGRLADVAWPAATLSASLLALTRPDGLLFWAATAGALVVFLVACRLQSTPARGVVVSLMGLGIVPLHLLWRRYYYHDWLPNTYYAKVGSPWPDMGLTYLLSYCIEYALYVPVFIALVCCISMSKKKLRVAIPLGWLLVLGTVTLQILYYTLIVGGDHFEYRVFHHLIPLTVIALCVLLTTARCYNRPLLLCMVVWLGMQAVIPWTHWYYSKDLYSRVQTLRMVVPIADKVPRILEPLCTVWDKLQAKMIAHSVCMRHQEHKVFYLFQRATFPSRAEGMAMHWSDRHILTWGSVGVPGWVFPNAAVVDLLGLNDRVLAKSGRPHPADRQMAHDIAASNLYAECYMPDIAWSPDRVKLLLDLLVHEQLQTNVAEGHFGLKPVFRARGEVLSDTKIHSCESYPWTIAELYSDKKSIF